MVDNQNNQEEPNFVINFAEAQGFEPFDPPEFTERAVVRPLKQDGYYMAKITQVTRRLSKKNNGVFSLRLEVQDEDETGAAVYADITVTGLSSTDSKRPNIYSLVPVLLSTGRTMDDVQDRINRGDQVGADVLAAALTQEGKNICYIYVKHELQTIGKNAGKEKATVKTFITQQQYDSRKGKRGGIRWDKKLGNEATAGSNGTVTMPDMTAHGVVAGILG